MTNFANPINSSLVTDVLSLLKDRDVSVAKMDFTGDTNLSTGFVRYNRTNRVLEEWSGSAWVEQRLEPAGLVKPFAGAAAPRGHLLCDGSAVSRTTYAALFAAIATTYGAGDGSTTFNLPNLSGKFPLGKAQSGTGSTLGATGGSLDHTHSVPAHYHSMGAGADLRITSSGQHDTSVDIGHAHTASSLSASSNTFISQNKTESATVSLVDPGHSHKIPARDGIPNTVNSTLFPTYTTGDTTKDRDRSTGTSSTNIYLENGTHYHSVAISDPGHSHTVVVDELTSTLRTNSQGQHEHAPGSFNGSIGVVTGGANGNAAFATLANNPPFIVLNYVITI